MPQASTPRSSLGDSLREAGAETRHREIAVEHLLFHTVMYLERQAPGLLDHLEGTLGALGDHTSDDTKDDEAVREVARLFLHSVRRNG